MSIVQKKKGTTRRGFVLDVAAGAGGIALAGSLRAALSPARTGLLAAPARTGQYDKNILTGEIRNFQDLQVFELKGKDARGYDFAVQLSPVDAIPLMNEKADAVNADRVKVYIGGNPENVKDISTEIEIAMGKEAEAYKINSASVAYIPKGMPFRQKLLRKAEKESFVLTLTLPPKYIEPEKPKQ